MGCPSIMKYIKVKLPYVRQQIKFPIIAIIAYAIMEKRLSPSSEIIPMAIYPDQPPL